MLASDKKHLLKFTYDFSKDGGAVGAIALSPQPNDIGDNYVVLGAYVHVIEALTSGGSATVTLGNTTDADGYMEDFFSLGAAGKVVVSGEVAGALLWDDTNDHALAYNVGTAAANKDLNLTVGTAALTAGKLSVYLEVMALA